MVLQDLSQCIAFDPFITFESIIDRGEQLYNTHIVNTHSARNWKCGTYSNTITVIHGIHQAGCLERFAKTCEPVRCILHEGLGQDIFYLRWHNEGGVNGQDLDVPICNRRRGLCTLGCATNKYILRTVIGHGVNNLLDQKD